MNYEIPVICYDVPTNRATTKNQSFYFNDKNSLIQIINQLQVNDMQKLKDSMAIIAKENYTWEIIASKYSNLFLL